MIKLIYVMKKGKITLLCLVVAMLAVTSTYSQNIVYSTIAKNINSEANSLQHNLNRAGDTLHLSSDFKLYKVEFIGTYESKVFPVEGETKQISIPLASVPVGEYTIAAFQIEKTEGIYQDQKTIVFRISRLLPIEDPIIEEELLAEVVPEIIEEEPIIKEEEAVVAEVKKETPVKKESVNKGKVEKEIIKKDKVKKEIIKENKTSVTALTPKLKKERVKKEVVKENKTRVAILAPKVKKEYTKPERPIVGKELVIAKPERKSRVVERKEPSLDSTEYKSYNLTNGRNGRYAVQSREAYRAENLRPNGEPYN
ncbi:hypothetical protein [Lacinutrix sp. MEBiC02404]